MAKLIWRNALVGGGDALDGVDHADLENGDCAIVVENNNYHFFLYDSTSVETELVPSVIRPNTGTGAWIKQAQAETRVKTITSNYTAQPIDEIIYIDATANNVTLTLIAPALATARNMKVIRKDSSVNTATIQAAGGTVSGEASITLVEREGYELIPDSASADYLLL
jgi:hypothetical protein